MNISSCFRVFCYWKIRATLHRRF